MLFPLRATFASTAALSLTHVWGQSTNFTYVDCTDQTQIRRTGSWNDQGLPAGTNFSLDTSKIYNGTWELASNPPNATKPASLEFSFIGNAVVVVGIVVNGVEGQSLNFSVQLDDQEPSAPIYKHSATASNNTEHAYQLFTQSGLTSNRHTIKAALTGDTSNFLLDMIAYTPVLPGSLLESSATTSPITTSRSSASTTIIVTPATSSTDPASLGGAIGGGVGALLLVILFIWYMMRRITKKEAREVQEAPRPWVMVPSTPARSPPPPSSSEGSRRAPSSFTKAPRRDRKIPIVVNPPRSVVNQLRSVVNPVNRPRSPVDSTISLPTEFYPLSPTYQPTAVASSQIGTVPLPDVPQSPRDTIHESQPNLSQKSPSTSVALGLHSHSDSRRSGRGARQSDGGLLRPLPLPPGTNRVGTFTYPPEKQSLPDSERPITKS